MALTQAAWLKILLVMLLALSPAAGSMLPMSAAEPIVNDGLILPLEQPEAVAGVHHAGHHGVLAVTTASPDAGSASQASAHHLAASDPECETLCLFCINHCSVLSLGSSNEPAKPTAIRGVSKFSFLTSAPQETLYRPPIFV